MISANPFSLEGKIILVTGASSGIGRGVAVASSQMGAKVIAIGRNKKRLEETLDMLTGESHQSFICDITKTESVKELVSSLPPLDGIVHCAGVDQRIPAKQLSEKDVDCVMNINFRSPVLLQSCLLQQKKVMKGASIVFVASIASWSPSIGHSIYSASKGAIVSYSKCLALELAPRKIRVNCISPAMVWTDLIKNSGVSEEQLKSDESKYPLKRYGTPEDVANLALYMLSDASTWMTGTNVDLTGGGN